MFFGLFHGLALLPVVLSLIGPDPYPSAGKKKAFAVEERELECNDPENQKSMLPKPEDAQTDPENNGVANGFAVVDLGNDPLQATALVADGAPETNTTDVRV